jgi:serine phosphatase RsbU (regulator of sigma subunit)/predicted ATPase
MEQKPKAQYAELGHLHTKTPYIGRQYELTALINLAETVMAGLGRVAVVFGEPGIGKSRLINQWKEILHSKHADNFPRWIEVQTATFDQNPTYNLLKTLFRSIIDSLNPDHPITGQSALFTHITEKYALLTEAQVRYLVHFLDDSQITGEEKFVERQSLQEIQDRLNTTLKAILMKITKDQPLIIIIEDLQLADQSSISLLTNILPLIPNLPVLLCLISRKEQNSNGWQLISAARNLMDHRCIDINLSKFSNEESRSLVRQYDSVIGSSDHITQIILDKADGNPLFLDELMRMIIRNVKTQHKNQEWLEKELIDKNLIPNSLQALLETQINRLNPDTQLTLRIASVIGRSFSFKLIEAILKEYSQALQPLELLNTLEVADMIQVEKVQPELVYSFRHVLFHQAVYMSIDEQEIVKLHNLVGTKLEEIYHDQTDKAASQLAHHFTLANHPKKALEYLHMAGKIALDAYASIEAESYLTQALQMASEKPIIAQLYQELGLALANQSRHSEAIQAWQKALTLHQELGNSDQLARIYAYMARSIWEGLSEENRRRSLNICLEGLKAVEGAPESAEIAFLIHETGRAYAFIQKHDEAQCYAEKALAMAERLNAYQVQVEALATLAILPSIDFDQSVKFLKQAIKISENHHLYSSGARAYNNLSAINQSLINFRKARDYALKATALSEKSSFSINTIMVKQGAIACSIWLGELDDIEESFAEMQHFLEVNPNQFDRHHLNQLFLESGYYRIKAEFPKAAEKLTSLIEESRAAEDYARVLEGIRALVDLSIDQYFLEGEKPTNFDIKDSIKDLEKALELGQDIPYQTIAAVYCLFSTLYTIQGNDEKAEKALENAELKYDQIASFKQNLWQLSKYNIQPSLTTLHRPARDYITLTKARLEMAKGNHNQAIALYKECIKKFNQQESIWWEARTKLELGSAYLQCNDPEDIELAQIAFREARITFSNLDIKYYSDLAIERLREVRNQSRAQIIAHKKLTLELTEAGTIQHSLIPSDLPRDDNFQLSGMLLSAKEMSGDFYDYYQLNENQLGIVIADVADKGAGAALYMAMSRSLLRTYAAEAHLPPEQVLSEVNRRLLTDTPNGIFLTLFYGILNLKSGQFSYVNAGHNPPYLIKEKQDQLSIISLDKTGPLAGIFPDSVWQTEEIYIQAGDKLVLYTDGIIEAQNNNGDYYGNFQFINSLKSNYGLEAELFQNAILQNVLNFTTDAPRLDDITLVVLTMKKEAQLIK